MKIKYKLFIQKYIIIGPIYIIRQKVKNCKIIEMILKIKI